MSRGYGSVQRAILAVMDANPEDLFTIRELISLEHEITEPTEAMRKSYERAIRKLLAAGVIEQEGFGYVWGKVGGKSFDRDDDKQFVAWTYGRPLAALLKRIEDMKHFIPSLRETLEKHRESLTKGKTHLRIGTASFSLTEEVEQGGQRLLECEKELAAMEARLAELSVPTRGRGDAREHLEAESK